MRLKQYLPVGWSVICPRKSLNPRLSLSGQRFLNKLDRGWMRPEPGGAVQLEEPVGSELGKSVLNTLSRKAASPFGRLPRIPSLERTIRSSSRFSCQRKFDAIPYVTCQERLLGPMVGDSRSRVRSRATSASKRTGRGWNSVSQEHHGSFAMSSKCDPESLRNSRP